jgi:N,N-dimethylformamidase
VTVILTAYCDQISVAPGDRIRCMVNCEGAKEFRAELQRIVCGDENPDGPGYRADRVPVDLGGPFPARRQAIRPGSYGLVPGDQVPAGLSSFSITVLAWPTTPRKGRQALVAAPGLFFCLDDAGRLLLELESPGNRIALHAESPVLERHWHLLGASYDAEAGRLTLLQEPLRRYPRLSAAGEHSRSGADVAWRTRPGALTFAAAVDGDGAPSAHYNGKLEAPRLFAGALAADELRRWGLGVEADLPRERLLAAWDFSRDIPTTEILDVSGNGRHGRLVNLPARAVTGYRWTGECQAWTERPEHYGAIHFHDDDLYDAQWTPDLELQIPTDLKSGVYAFRLSAGNAEYFVPFAVRAPRGGRRAKFAFLLPTASYMAYANHRIGIDYSTTEIGMGRLVELNPTEVFKQEHPEYGLSCYEQHNDGSGVMYSSRLRPILDMQPKQRIWLGGPPSSLWQFNADTHILAWLEHLGEDYDVLTDEDLHREGARALEGYRVLITGTHPEYHSAATLDAIEGFTGAGGRLMYLGGNGFYWRVAYHPTLPGVIELRRAESGIRPWVAEPGEYYHSFTGEYGGLWRRLGRPANRLVGVGMSAQGFDISSPYLRRPGSRDPRAAFIFEGVPGEVIGDHGLIGGGAAGMEVERADTTLGTPPHALVLASSERHTDCYMLVPEELGDPTPDSLGTDCELIRADMVFFETANGGAVFSAGSIAYAGSLWQGGYRTDIARITENVLRRFLDPKPL